MKLETDRLYLIPLTAKQLKLWIENCCILEKEMDCKCDAEPLESVFLDIVKQQYEMTKKEEENYCYYSFWFLIRKSDRIVVGSASFKNIPNENGEIEIGYGLGKKYEHNGYMTEAVKMMCKWAIKQNNVSHVIAETEMNEIASQRLLKECGFEKYEQDDTAWWRL